MLNTAVNIVEKTVNIAKKTIVNIEKMVNVVNKTVNIVVVGYCVWLCLLGQWRDHYCRTSLAGKTEEHIWTRSETIDELPFTTYDFFICSKKLKASPQSKLFHHRRNFKTATSWAIVHFYSEDSKWKDPFLQQLF